MMEALKRILGIGEARESGHLHRQLSEARDRLKASVSRVEDATAHFDPHGLSEASEHLRNVSLEVIHRQRQAAAKKAH